MPRFRGRGPDAAEATIVAAIEDARRLVLELAGRVPAQRVDPMRLGLVLEPGESAARAVRLWVRSLDAGVWSEAESCLAVVTGQRVFLRRAHGALKSLWWGTVVGVEVDLRMERVVLDFGDGCPSGLFGPQVAVPAVMDVACLYGIEGLVRHPGLECLRGPLPARSS